MYRVNASTKRNVSIDVARGIGILLVVLGHSWFADTQVHADFRNVLATFRMPLFFFVSGLFLSVAARPGIFVGVRADALLKPYFVVLLSVWAAFATRDFLFGETSWAEVARSLGAIFYGTGPVLAIAPLWFLPVLLLTSLCCYLLARAVPETIPARSAWLLAAGAILLALWVPRIDSFWGLASEAGWRKPGPDALPGLPWSIDLLPISVAFMISGYALRQQASRIDFRPLSLLLVAGLFLGLWFAFEQSMDLNGRRYDSLLVVTAQAAAGIYLVLGLSAGLARIPRARVALVYVGQGALFVLLFHYHIQRYVFWQTQGHLPNRYVAAALALVVAVAVPLVMWEIAKRSRLLTALLLPSRRPGPGLNGAPEATRQVA